jgi:hypothetical protein
VECAVIAEPQVATKPVNADLHSSNMPGSRRKANLRIRSCMSLL